MNAAQAPSWGSGQGAETSWRPAKGLVILWKGQACPHPGAGPQMAHPNPEGDRTAGLCEAAAARPAKTWSAHGHPGLPTTSTLWEGQVATVPKHA